MVLIPHDVGSSAQPNDERSRSIKSIYRGLCMIVRLAIAWPIVAVLVLFIVALGKTLQGY